MKSSFQAHSSGFNPRPPLLAGDARLSLRHVVVVHVSIRARHCWRAMRQELAYKDAETLVSIRARHCWRAMRFNFAARPRLGLFQSAPAIAGGRCFGGPTNERPAPRFNPRPPLLAGDARVLTVSTSLNKVSIRARHCWRAMQVDLVYHDVGPAFQSAPAIAGGRCERVTRVNPLTGVSIRARHCWRAMP